MRCLSALCGSHGGGAMRLVGALVFALFATSASAAIYPLPVPDWVIPTMEAAPPHSGERFALALWVLGWPCPDFDAQFAPPPPSLPLHPYLSPIGSGETPVNPSPVPEPATWLLMLLGFASMLLARRLSCVASR